MQPQYRNYAHNMPAHVQRSPHVPPPPARRGGIGPMMTSGPDSRVPLTQAQVAQAQQQQIAANERARIRSRKPTDKTMPDGVENVIIGDGVQRYRDLRDFERHLDATMTRKRLDVADSASRSAKRFKTMRIWVTNTAHDQPWQNEDSAAVAFDFEGNADASFRVKVEGRLLDDGDEIKNADGEDEAGDALNGLDKMETDEFKESAKPALISKPAQPQFSQFFRSISVDFGRSKLRNGADHSVEWKRPERPQNAPGPSPPFAEFDEFTFRRNADENLNIVIKLERLEEPERYQLSPDLSDIVDMTTGTRAEVVMALWEYIRLMELQEDEEKRTFRCDELLRKIIDSELGWIPHLGEYINRHIQPLAPIELPYTIRLDQTFQSNPTPTIFDIRVAVPDPLRQTFFQTIHDPNYVSMLKDVVQLDDKLAIMIQAIADSKAKHHFLSSIVADPANFTRDWMSSQKRDLEVIMGEATARGGGSEDTAGDEWRRGGRDSMWGTQNAKESVNVMLSKIPAQSLAR